MKLFQFLSPFLDALEECNGKEVQGARMNVEWAKGSGKYEPRGGGGGGGSDRRESRDDVK